jgi:predicted transcriptional regulator
MSKTIRELADEFGVSKQAIRKKLDANFRANYVQTVTRNGVQTLVVVNSGYLLLKQHFDGGNSQQVSGNFSASNTGKNNINTVEFLKQQISIKDSQLKEKDEQLKSMQKLLDQSQRLHLIAEKKIETLNVITSKQREYSNSESNSSNTINGSIIFGTDGNIFYLVPIFVLCYK